ncbi:MAG: hypothetical protein HYW23_01960 [Candidatus Aenigmarchaeota archaeon]|nr:hypothetical protein [Candidatus Aenigmarchaeota archaeon]
MDTSILENVGLEKREADVYMTLLRYGSSTATYIAREAKIERTLVYRILDKLIDKGYANFIIENKIKKFRAVNPETFLFEFKEKEKEFLAYLPKLKSIVNEKKKEPTIELYRGTNGIRSLTRELLRRKQDYVAIVGKTYSSLDQFFKLFAKAIEETNIHERVLVKEGQIIIKSKNTEIRYLPKNYEYNSPIVISNETIAIILESKTFLTILIEDKNLAQTFKSYFELLWTIAKK